MMKGMMDINITGIDYAVYKSMVTASKLNIDFYHFLDSFSKSQSITNLEFMSDLCSGCFAKAIDLPNSTHADRLSDRLLSL